MKILMIGSSSDYGKPVAQALERAGHQIRILTKNLTKARFSFPSYYEFFFGDYEKVEDLEKALKGCQAVHINIIGGPSISSYYKLIHIDTSRIAQIAAHHGVERLTFLSSAYIKQENFKNPDIKSKFLAEHAIRNSRVPHTIFRTTWLMEHIPHLIKEHRSNIPMSFKEKIHWLSTDDLGDMIANALTNQKTLNKTLTVGGIDELTIEEAIGYYKRFIDPEIKIKHLAKWAMKINSFFGLNEEKRDLFRNYFIDFEIENYILNQKLSAKLVGHPIINFKDWCIYHRSPLQVSA